MFYQNKVIIHENTCAHENNTCAHENKSDNMNTMNFSEEEKESQYKVKFELSNGYYLRFGHLSRVLHCVVGRIVMVNELCYDQYRALRGQGLNRTHLPRRFRPQRMIRFCDHIVTIIGTNSYKFS